MKQIIKISSPNNETMKSFFNLRDKKTRNKEQKFLIEGYHLIEEASKTNYLECVITSDEKNDWSISGYFGILCNRCDYKKIVIN